MVDEKDDLANAESTTAIAVISDDAERALQEFPVNAFVPSSPEQLEMVANLEALQQELEDGIGGTTKPTDLADAGTVFDIVDAYMTDFVENGVVENKIMFHLVEHETNIFHKVMQSDDSKGIRRKYAILFSGNKALGRPLPVLNNYRFVYGDKIIAGNRAVILERAKPQLNSVNA